MKLNFFLEICLDTSTAREVICWILNTETWIHPVWDFIMYKVVPTYGVSLSASVYLSEKPSLELCKSLIMLRDYNISGRISVVDIPVLMHMLQFWRVRLRLMTVQ